MRLVCLLSLMSCGSSAETSGQGLPMFERPAAPDCGAKVLADLSVLPRAPYLNGVRTDSATVAFAGPDAAQAGVVRYGRDASVSEHVQAIRETVPGAVLPLSLFHADLSGLEAGTTYCYAIEIDGVTVAEGTTLTTSVPPGFNTTVRFLAIGDFGAGTPEQLQVRDAMAEVIDEVDLFITLGDNAYSSGTYSEWQRNVFVPNRELLTDVAYWPTWGNHDYSTDDAAPALANHFLPRQTLKPEHHERYWSLDYGPLHIIGLDSEGSNQDGGERNQIDWATQDLADQSAPWTLAAWHKPAFTGHETRSGDFLVRTRLQPLVEENGVDVVLTGHDHFYERFHPVRAGERVSVEDGGIPWIISGGGGRGLYVLEGHENEAYGEERHHFLLGEVDQCNLIIRAIGVDGAEFDRLEMSRC